MRMHMERLSIITYRNCNFENSPVFDPLCSIFICQTTGTSRYRKGVNVIQWLLRLTFY